LCASAKADVSPTCGLPAALEMANADRCLGGAHRRMRGAAGRTKFGDSHELLGLSFPRRVRYSRQHASHVAATTSAAAHAARATAAAAPAVTSAGHAARAATSNSACVASGNAARATASDPARAASGDAARTSASDTACAAARAAGALRSADWILARHAARD